MVLLAAGWPSPRHTGSCALWDFAKQKYSYGEYRFVHYFHSTETAQCSRAVVVRRAVVISELANYP
jgi:hypothetical protein